MVRASGGPGGAARFPRPSPVEWLYLAVGLALVFRYRWYFDDAFIYFRYVDNFLFLNIGLTYSAGEYVEGYSSPLHCLVLIAMRSLHLGFPVIVVLLGLGCFAVFWYLLVCVHRGLWPGPDHANTLNVPLAYLSVNYSVTSFFTSGNETALTHMVVAAAALLVLRPRSRVAVLVAASPLARPELAITMVLTMAYVWWRIRRVPRLFMVAALVINGGWLLFRVYYYADLLPNTFYLKHGTNIAAGARYLRDLTDTYHVLLVFSVFAVLLIAVVRGRSRRGEDVAVPLALVERGTMVLISLATATYTVLSGGSEMHYYYLAPSFILAVCALGGVLEAAVDETGLHLSPAPRFAGMVGVSLLFFSWYPDSLSTHPVTLKDKMTRPPSPTVTTDPSWYRGYFMNLQQLTWPTIAAMRSAGETLRERGRYERWTTTPWCFDVYAHPDTRSVHGLGLTDGILSRVDTWEVKRGHKPDLLKLARAIPEIQQAANRIGPGMYLEAVQAGRAPDWVEDNLETINLIERKIYNRHDLLENIRLALAFPPRIQAGVSSPPARY